MTAMRTTALVTAVAGGLLLSTVAAPPAGAGTCGTYSGKGCAPPSSRVDLQKPVFSHPTDITNPLFPISDLHSALLLGHVDGKAFRTETTLLPGTSTVVVDGERIEVLRSQYMAWLGGRLEEVAIDRYAQADDGSVWYLGEDVFDYRDGTVALTEGTWLAGRDGPPAMIMPGRPAVGDVFRPENVPGVVFEEVRVAQVGLTVRGPMGPVPGAILTSELHLDGTRESKVFAPGYGEFRTGGGGDLEAMALAVPADAGAAVVPPALVRMTTGSTGVLEAVRLGDWRTARVTTRLMRRAWTRLRATDLPWRVERRLDRSLDRLTVAVRERRAISAQQTVDVSQLLLDLHLRHQRPDQVDVERLVLWTQQLRIDAAARRRGAVAGDVAVIEWVRDRVTPSFTAAELAEVDARIAALRDASDARNLTAAADHAARLAARLRELAT